MVNIPYLKIPQIHIRGISSACDIYPSQEGSGNISPNQPTPITYLTQWKIVGNSEVHTLPYPDGVVLPGGYKRCEYLESDGTAYIEVPFGFDKTDEVYAKAAMLEAGNDTYFVSPKIWNNANNRFGMGLRRILLNNKLQEVYSNPYGSIFSGELIPYINADNAIREWEYKNYICSMGGSSKDNSNISFGSETANLRLFYGYNTPTKCKIYEYRHKKANAEYRLIPCLDSNNTPCMYDVINNQAYYNSADSGSLTYELYPQSTEIWSCGEYSAVDSKYHILVQPLGGSIADIALDEPLRKVNDVADTIEFPSNTEGKALVTRNLGSQNLGNYNYRMITTVNNYRAIATSPLSNVKIIDITKVANILCALYTAVSSSRTSAEDQGIALSTGGNAVIYDEDYNQEDSASAFKTHVNGVEIIYELATPTTELVDAPQIAEAESYSCVISQGGKAVSWSSFETE